MCLLSERIVLHKYFFHNGVERYLELINIFLEEGI